MLLMPPRPFSCAEIKNAIHFSRLALYFFYDYFLQKVIFNEENSKIPVAAAEFAENSRRLLIFWNFIIYCVCAA